MARTQATLDAARAQLAALATQTGSKTEIVTYSVDVSDEAAVNAAVAAFAAKYTTVDCLIASAGVSTPNHIDDIPVREFERMVRINYLGVVICTKAVLPAMKAQKSGRIVLISSMAGQAGIFGYSAYAPTKFAVRGFAEVLHMEARPHGIAVSVCNPPDVDTPMYAAEMAHKPEECKLMSEGTGLFPAADIARDVVAGIERYRFFIQTGFDGHVLGCVTAGFSPVDGGATALIQVLSASVLRAVAIGYVWMYNGIAKSVHDKRVKAAAAATAAGAAAPVAKKD